MEKTKNSGERFNLTEILSYLDGADYPMSKEDLISLAKEKNAPEPIIQVLEKMAVKDYPNSKEVSQELKKHL